MPIQNMYHMWVDHKGAEFFFGGTDKFMHSHTCTQLCITVPITQCNSKNLSSK